MKFKLLTYLIIASNILLLAAEMPDQVLFLALSTLILSWPQFNKILRQSIKIVLLIATLFIIQLNFAKIVSTEAAVSFLLILSALKAWELENDSDRFNMFLILALCESGVFLLMPTFMVFAFGIIKMIFYFYYIMTVRKYDISVLNFKRVILLTTPALIFSLILFYTFPRFTQGFVNTAEMQAAYTGANSNFDFRNLGPLNPSTEQVFRVTGLEEAGVNPSLAYWRSHVLWENKDQEWKSGYHNLKAPRPDLDNVKQYYKVELLQKFKEFLPTLDGSSIVLSPLPSNYYLEGSYRLKVPTRSDLTYDVKGTYGTRQSAMNNLMYRKGLKFSSEKTDLIKARFFAGQAIPVKEDEKLRFLVQSFKARGFKYSLTPPLYASIEDFLLKGDGGYCTHFAAALALLARTIEMPSRIVVGYLGGEINPYDGSVIVREQDAHAWTEIYTQEKGWVRIDPTALVVPMRAQMSAREFFDTLNPYVEFLNFRFERSLFNAEFIRKTGFLLDTLNSKLSTNIFNLDRDEQTALLRRINPMGIKSGWFFSLGVMAFLSVTYLIFFLMLQSKTSKTDRRYKRFLKTMSNNGVIKERAETALQFQKKCLQLLPAKHNYILKETNFYINQTYDRSS